MVSRDTETIRPISCVPHGTIRGRFPLFLSEFHSSVKIHSAAPGTFSFSEREASFIVTEHVWWSYQLQINYNFRNTSSLLKTSLFF